MSDIDLNTLFQKGCIRYGDYKEYKMCSYLRSIGGYVIDLEDWERAKDLNTYREKGKDDDDT